MGTIHAMDHESESLAIREPRQQRTREQWERVLDAGVNLLEEGGYESFTIAAVCHRANVPPRALYARTDSKDGLFLAVYERGIQRVLASQQVFIEPDGWDLEPAAVVARAVSALVHIFEDNARFLRAIVLISGAHPETARRGQAYRRILGDLFTAVLAPVDVSSPHEDPAAAREFCFGIVFSALVVRSAYGPAFGFSNGEHDLTLDLTRMAERYLISN